MELDTLLLPVKLGAGRCGDDLIFSPEFDAIREARRFDDPSLAQGEWVTPIKEAQWDKVTQICQDILIKNAKDLRVAAWLAEAGAKTDGLGGLARGYRLLTRLCETYWEDIHPQSDDGDPEQRIGALDWLLNQSAQWIRKIPLTRSPRGAFSLIDQEVARSNARNGEYAPGDGSSAAPSLEIFDAAVADTPTSHFSASLRAALDLQQAMAALRTVLDGYLADQAPAFGPSFDALDNVLRFLRRHAAETNGAANSAKVSAPLGITVAPSFVEQPAIPPAAAPGSLLTREQAVRQLQEIATFFRRSEPHSPVAYLADKAARWASMPLHEWLRHVVRDGAALSHVEELLGVEQQLSEADGN